MSSNAHKSYDGKFKLKVALEAIKADKPIEKLCQDFDVAISQVYAWKKQIEEQGDVVFADKRKTEKSDGASEKKLQTKLEKVMAERDFLARVLNH